MSSINAPQWFKDALRDWETAVFLPLPDLNGEKYTYDWGYFSPQTIKDSPFISSSDVDVVKSNPHSDDSASQYQYPNRLFMPFEKGVWGNEVRCKILRLAGSEAPALKNGAIIIMGYGIGGEEIGRLDVSNGFVDPGFWESKIAVGDEASWSKWGGYVNNPSAIVRTRYSLDRTNINNGSAVYYADNPPHDYRDFCLPQFRCTVLGISPTGDCVVGQGHPMYAHMRDKQQDYISIGTINDIENLQAIECRVFDGNVGGELDLKSIPVFAGVTFIEVLIPNVNGIVFPPIAGESNWWKNHNNTTEAKVGGLILDKRGFPIDGINYTPGVIPPDPV